jgi:hypothetical protein
MAGKAKFEIVAEDKTAAAWRSALGNAKTSTDRIRGMLGAAFAGIGITAVVGLSRQAIALGDDLSRAAIAAGISGKALSQLAYVAKQSDVELKTLSTSIRKMQIALSEARTGGKQQIETLQALGLTIKDLQGLDADKQFEILGDRISMLKDPTDRARAAVELFGKAGADLLPLFADGAKGIQKLRREAEEIGATLTDDQIQALANADAAIKKLDSAWDHFWAKMVARAGNSGVTDWLNRLSGSMPLEQRVRQQQFLVDNENGWESDESREKHKRTLQALLREQDLANAHPELGGRGTRVSGSGPEVPDAPPGFTNTAAIEAEKKEQEKFLKDYRDSVRDMNADVDREADDQLKRDNDRWLERQDQARGYYEKWKQSEQDVNEWRETQWRESAAVFRDYFVNAIGDMINTGKFQWRDFLSFMIAEVARRQIGKMFDSIFNSAAANGGGGGGGWFSAIFGAVVNSYAGNVSGALASGSAVEGRANGGDVQAGSVYRINENTPNSELWMPGVSGTVLGRGSLGGVNAPISLTIDARGATEDAIKLLPSFGKQLIDQAEERIVGRLRRDYYGLNQ